MRDTVIHTQKSFQLSDSQKNKSQKNKSQKNISKGRINGRHEDSERVGKVIETY